VSSVPSFQVGAPSPAAALLFPWSLSDSPPSAHSPKSVCGFEGLELDGVSTSISGRVYQTEGKFQTAIVIHTRFGDDEAWTAFSNSCLAELNMSHKNDLALHHS